VKTPVLAAEGIYTLHLALQGATPAENSETVQVIAQAPDHQKAAQVGVVGDVALIAKELEPAKNLHVEAYDPAKHYDVIVAAQKANGTIVHINDGSRIANTEDDALYYNSIRGGTGAFTLRFAGLPAGAAKVSLYFADAADAKPGSRTFDILINKQTVAKAFDIAAEAHGGATAVVKSFDVNAADGVVEITPGAVTGVSMSYRAALFNAVKIEAGGKSFAYALGGETYTDHHGLVWNSYLPPSNLTAEVLEVVKAGTPLILTAPDASSATPALKLLDATGALKFHGVVPSARASWMGDWVFTGSSALFAGLGKNEVAHGDYQLNVNNSYGVQVDGPGVQVLAGYGRDHGQTLGAAAFTAPLGKGTVLFDGLVGSPVPVVKTRLLTNAIQLLLTEEK
jgi:hypothetical protein